MKMPLSTKLTRGPAITVVLPTSPYTLNALEVLAQQISVAEVGGC
jgi:hypothetical protein